MDRKVDGCRGCGTRRVVGVIAALYAAAGALLCGHVLLWGRKRAASIAAFAGACGCASALAWLGMDFSPSFTMMFLTANLILCALAELLALCRSDGGGRIARTLEAALFAAGTLFSLPATFIYAAGDDWLNACMLAAVLAGAVLAAAVAVAGKRRGRRMEFHRIALCWFCLSAASFALACGLRSTMLLLYGGGLLLMAIGRSVGEGRARTLPFCLGMLLAAAMSVAPML